MDDIKDYELELLFDLYSNADRSSWEQTRLLMYTMLAPYRKKGSNTKPTDILPLPWDNGYEQSYKQSDKPLTQEQVDMLRERSEKIKDSMKSILVSKKQKKKEHGKR